MAFLYLLPLCPFMCFTFGKNKTDDRAKTTLDYLFTQISKCLNKKTYDVEIYSLHDPCLLNNPSLKLTGNVRVISSLCKIQAGCFMCSILEVKTNQNDHGWPQFYRVHLDSILLSFDKSWLLPKAGGHQKVPRNAFMGCLNALIVDCFILDPPVYPITSKEHRNSIQRECHDLYGKSPALSPARFWKALRAEIMSSWSSNFCKMLPDSNQHKGVPQKWCTGLAYWELLRFYAEFTKRYMI